VLARVSAFMRLHVYVCMRACVYTRARLCLYVCARAHACVCVLLPQRCCSGVHGAVLE